MYTLDCSNEYDYTNNLHMEIIDTSLIKLLDKISSVNGINNLSDVQRFNISVRLYLLVNPLLVYGCFMCYMSISDSDNNLVIDGCTLLDTVHEYGYFLDN